MKIMIATSIKFKNHPCFKDHWSGLDRLTPISLIIGKNNTGKSHLLHVISELCSKNMEELKWDVRIQVPLDESSLQQVFRPGTSQGGLNGDHWHSNGVLFVDKTAEWTNESGQEEKFEILEADIHHGRVADSVIHERLSRIHCAMPKAYHQFHRKIFKHLLADRDIRPETASNQIHLAADGTGATNVVRRYINSSEAKFNRDLVQVEMLRALNQIFGDDGHFQEITVKHHDSSDSEKPRDSWEIYLKQEHKGLVSLSDSGSGLKTIFLVLLHLLIIPIDEGKRLSDYVFAFEELENNLHPSLLRNLLGFIKDKTSPNPASTARATPHFFLTTHSNVALDYFAGSETAQIIHVSHDGKSARTQTVDQSQKWLSVLWDLGTRPSDLLQANGVIWVEGPSDRIYLNKWIELLTAGKYKEGRHYQCAFYGGGLLANLQATSDEEADAELINLLKINPNAIVVSDSDKKSKSQRLKPRVCRIRDEFAKLDKKRSLHWVLGAREIENYLTGNLIQRILEESKAKLPDPSQYESFFRKDGERSYLEKNLKRKTFDKSDLAALTTSHMTIDDIQGRFDLDQILPKIISIIEVWNK